MQKFEENLNYAKSGKLKLLRDPIRTIWNKISSFIFSIINKPVNIKANTFWGDRIFLLWPESVSKGILHSGFSEEGLTRMLLEYLRPGMVFIDIGAHFGYFTILASRLVGHMGRVYSFEPTKSVYAILALNTKDKQNVHLNNTAVFSKSGSAIFNDYGIEFSAFNSIYEPRLQEADKKRLLPIRYEVKTITLDDYVYTHNTKPDFVKIDAESAEYDILLGMGRILKEIRPMITLEVGDVDLLNVHKSKDIILYLIDKGYGAYEYDGMCIKRHNIRDKYSYDNILFTPHTHKALFFRTGCGGLL